MALRFNGQVCLFGLKVVDSVPVGTALAQPKDKGYADKYRHLGHPIHLIGMEFSRKTRNLAAFEVESLETRWGRAAPGCMRGLTSRAPAALRKAFDAPAATESRSSLADAEHSDFPILIQAGGRAVVHEKASRRFRSDVEALGLFECIAPRGSEAEAEFLAAAEELFGQVLLDREGRTNGRP